MSRKGGGKPRKDKSPKSSVRRPSPARGGKGARRKAEAKRGKPVAGVNKGGGAKTGRAGAEQTIAVRHRPTNGGVAVVRRKAAVDVEQLEHLREKLREATETLEAIRSGEADAVVVTGPNGAHVYSLAGAEHPYRVYVEQMQEGAVTVSPDGMILYSNRRFAEMVRVPLEKVISAPIQTFLRAEDCERMNSVLGMKGGVVKHECVLRGAEGGVLPVYVSASRLPLEEQAVLCLVVTDLTEQKATNDLRVAKESAEKASLAKDHFLAALSHELRTPLTPALMAAMNLEHDTQLPERVRQEVAMIRRNVELEARLIDDLLDLTRIARGKLELHTAPTDLHASLARAIEICRLDVEAKGQAMRVALGATHTRMDGDPVRLQQAFWNLIRNAVKFTPPQGKIEVRTEDLPSGRIRIVVVDSGIGFAPELADRMFDAFEQGSRQITRQFGGLGLGLAISKSIVEAHGGSVQAGSLGAGRGATFTIELPVETPAEVAAAPAGGALPAASGAAASAGRPLRILLVEDHKDTRASMERLLRKYQHEVRTAESGKRALELAAAEPFDLVISDLGLPDVSGLELMQQLRDRHQLKGICVSGYGMEEDVANSRRAGFVQHLTKPINLERLKRVIREVTVSTEA